MLAKSILLFALLTVPALAQDAARPDADHLLRQMSAKLAATRSFSFVANREIDPGLLAGGDLPEKARIAVTVQRPNKLVAKSVSRSDVRHVYADGRNLSIFDAGKNFYATVPLHASIDGVLEEIQGKYGFTPPLAEFARSDVYGDMRRRTQRITYLGRTRYAPGLFGLGGVECDRIALSGKGVDAELWVAVSDRLPRRLIATVKTYPGRPQVKVDFLKWSLQATATSGEFVFVPPSGALKIPMKRTEELAAVKKKGAAKKG